jgi:hypothetical protein
MSLGAASRKETRMKRVPTVVLAAATAVLAVPLTTQADREGRSFKASLNSFREVPSLSTTGRGEFRARIVDDETIAYELSWSGLEGTDVLAAHIHLGQPGVIGGVIAFLCGGDKPACPDASSAAVTGEIAPENVAGPEAQGIAPGEFAEVLRALRAGAVYANVHTDIFPGGEIRGQVENRHDRD